MRQRGITLLEMLLVALLLIILLSIAAPVLTEMLHKQRASSYMQQLSRHLHYARIQAASSQLPVRLCPQIAEQCSANWQQVPLQLTLLNPLTNQQQLLRQLPAITASHQLSYNRTQLQFRRDGSLDALENGTFYYCPPIRYQWHYRLVLNQAGRNRLSLHQTSCPI